MSISDLYSSGAHRKDIGHFANIVKLAKADSIITDSEQKLIDRMSKRLDISAKEYKEILESPEKFPINPPVSYDERIERLYNLSKMIFADDEVVRDEALILRKVVVGLGFSSENSEMVADEAIHLMMDENNIEEFTQAIKNVNKR